MKHKRILLEQLSPEELSELTAEKVVEKVKLLLPQPEQPKYLTRKQTANRLNISLVTLNKWTREGILQSYRIASRIMYKPDEVDQAVQKRNIGTGRRGS